MRTALLKATNSRPSAIEDMYSASNLHIDFLKTDASQQLGRLFMSDALQRILERTNYHRLDIVFPLVAALMNRRIGMSERSMLTNVRNVVLISVTQGVHGLGNMSRTKNKLQVLDGKIIHFKKIVVDNFAEHCSTGIFCFEERSLEHTVEDVHRFVTPYTLDPSLFVH